MTDKKIKLTHEEEQSQWIQPPCMYCKYLITTGNQEMPFNPEDSLRHWTCKAFPTEIPVAVLQRKQSHTKAIESQSGNYVYEPKRQYDFEAGKAVMSFDGHWVQAE